MPVRTMAAQRTTDCHKGRRTIDLLNNARGVKLVALFSPEHGIAGTLDHDGIKNARDANSPNYLADTPANLVFSGYDP